MCIIPLKASWKSETVKALKEQMLNKQVFIHFLVE